MKQDHTPRTSGGEIQESEATHALRSLIQGEHDVRRIVDLIETADGKFLYLIETPFQTFPRFVIGQTDVENRSPKILLKCGSEWAADEAWRGFRQHPTNQALPKEEEL